MKRKCKITGIAVRGDQNIKVKELEKITRYMYLRMQLQKLQNVKATFILVAVGALGAVSQERESYLKTIGIPIVISCLQKAAFILGRAFDISDRG